MKNIQWKTVAVIAAAIVLLWFVFRSSVKRPVIPESKPVIEQAKKTNKAVIQVVDSAKLLRLKDDTIRMLRVQRDVAKKEVAKAGQELTRLASKVIDRKDTVHLPADCDSLAAAAEKYQDYALDLQEQYDDAMEAYARKDAMQSMLFERQKTLYAELRASFAELELHNRELTTSLKKENRKRKGERTFNRILAGAALVAGGLLITK